MGTKLSEQLAEEEKYRSSVHEFGVIASDRLHKTWLIADFLFRFSENYWKHEEVLSILHGFSKSMIEIRKKNFFHENDESSSNFYKRNMAMLDLLISAQKRGEDIDDEGIKEEVDTFVFEVRNHFNMK